MHGLALFTSALMMFAGARPEIFQVNDVYEIDARSFNLPVRIDPAQKSDIEQLHLVVSDNRGKSWQRVASGSNSIESLSYHAPADGEYWFALQFSMKDGSIRPQATSDLQAQMKVRVKTSNSALKPNYLTEADLRKEIDDLRRNIEVLEKKLAELEAGRKIKG